MTAFRFAFVLFFLGLALARAEPYVAGYQRFYGSSPVSQGGAILYSELGCANCHGGSEVEIPRSGPSLSNLANRLNYEWVVKFLVDPRAGHPGSTMPEMAHGLSDQEIDAIASYLGTIQEGKGLKDARHANAEMGSALYHEKGCVACHAPGADFRGPHGSGADFPEGGAVLFPDLQQKYSLTSLEDFLANVSTYRNDGRMPHIELTEQESMDIAAHLFDFQGSDPRELPRVKTWPKEDQKLISAGKTLVTKLNCAACHSIPGLKKEEIRPLKGETGGCLSEDPGLGIPRFNLSTGQRDSLTTFLTSEKAPDETLTFAALNCFACHSRDGIGGPTPDTNPFFVGDESLGDSGRLPPPLTGIGRKLKPEWLETLLAGKPETRVRSYLKTQMPKYPGQAKALAGWLTSIDQPAKVTPLLINPDDLEAGRKLIGIQGGVNCIICHQWADKKSLGIPGPDISSLDQRLRPEWFREYLLDPAGYRPGTLMPPLWPGGHSAVPDVLGGDTEKQIAAIWGFIKDGTGVPEGFPDRSSGQFELIPGDRPIIQRTFLERTGAKAILVGFPGEINIAYDGLKARPSLVWRGKFFDAYNTWFTRAAPFEKPLSEEVYEFAPSGEAGRFLGYRLDEKGNPTFISSRGEQEIEEHFEVREGNLIRTIRWKKGESPAVTHPVGVALEESTDANPQTYTYSWK